MYLEISARASGKTTRLLHAMKEEIALGLGVALLAPSYPMLALITKQLTKAERDKVHVYTYDAIQTFRPEQQKELDNLRFYCDEFDMYNGRLPISEKNYYCTTPTRLRSKLHMQLHKQHLLIDPLLDLVEHKKGYYVRYAMAGERNFDQFESYIPENAIDNEIWGKYKV